MVLSPRSEDVCQLSLPETQCGCCCIKDDRNGAADMAKKPRTSNGDLDDIEADHPAGNFHRSHQNQAPHGRAPSGLPRQCQNCRVGLVAGCEAEASTTAGDGDGRCHALEISIAQVQWGDTFDSNHNRNEEAGLHQGRDCRLCDLRMFFMHPCHFKRSAATAWCNGITNYNYVPLNLPITSFCSFSVSLLLSPISASLHERCALNPICPPASAFFAASNKGCFLGNQNWNYGVYQLGTEVGHGRTWQEEDAYARLLPWRFIFLFHNCSQVWCLKQLWNESSSHFEVTSHLKQLG